MKTAIVHDWLTGMRGGEKVLEALLELYPDATIYTLFCQQGTVSPNIAATPIVTSWLNHMPGIHRYYRNLLPLFPAAMASLKPENCDLVISSSHAAAKSVRAGKALHISYCHTPMRYLWDAEDDYAMSPAQRTVFYTMRSRLRKWDRESARGVDHFIANSQFVRGRIRRYYQRDAEVIHPPVDTELFSSNPVVARGDFYLAAGALVRYKRFDAIVQALNRMGKRLVVAGVGPEMRRLRAIAGPNIEFRGWVSDLELRDLYRRARALIFPGREDFGIVPVEAQSCGCPVIAFAGGGALETIQEGVSGILFAEQNPDGIAQAVERFETMQWSGESVRAHVHTFSRETFKNRIHTFIEAKASKAATFETQLT